MAIVPLKFFQRENVVEIAEELVGMVLCSNLGGHHVEGIIYETEAYCGVSDRACHAYPNRETPRTKIFYENGGLSYVYLCYGMHNLFNIITGPKGLPRAALIRAAFPIKNLSTINQRRNFSKHLADGPGKLSQAFGITRNENGQKLTKKNGLWVEDRKISLKRMATKRIGIDYAGKDAELPWRFLGQDIASLSSYQK